MELVFSFTVLPLPPFHKPMIAFLFLSVFLLVVCILRAVVGRQEGNLRQFFFLLGVCCSTVNHLLIILVVFVFVYFYALVCACIPFGSNLLFSLISAQSVSER